MARKKTTSTQADDRKRPIETYEHKDKQRLNWQPDHFLNTDLLILAEGKGIQ